MPGALNILRARRIAVLLCCFLIGSYALGQAPQSPEEELQFHADVPLGIQGFMLRPSGSSFYVMALAQNAAFEGMHQGHNGNSRVLLDARGQRVEYYPPQVTFRITASAWPEKLLDVGLFPVQSREDTNDYLLNLRFRLKVFHGLEASEVDAANVGLIGMPAEVPYNERIYGTTFDLGRIPIEDRIVLEVLAPNGERLCKFHLDLQ